MRSAIKIAGFLALAAIALGSLLRVERHQHLASHEAESTHAHSHAHGDAGHTHEHTSTEEMFVESKVFAASESEVKSGLHPHMHVRWFDWEFIVNLSEETEVPFREHADLQGSHREAVDYIDVASGKQALGSFRFELSWQASLPVVDAQHHYLATASSPEHIIAPDISSGLADDAWHIACPTIAPPVPPPRTA